MSSLAIFDVMARGGALSLMALLAIILVRDHRHIRAAQMAVLLLIGVSCFVIAEGTFDFAAFSPLRMALVLGESSISGFFWLFVRSWFNDETRFGWRSWGLVVFTLIISMINILSFNMTGSVNWPVDALMRALWVGLVIAGLMVAWRGRENDLVEARRRLRTTFVWAVGVAMIAVNVIYFYANVINQQRTTAFVTAAIIIGAALLTLFLATALLGIRRADLFAAVKATAPTPLEADDPAANALAQRIDLHMTQHCAWRDETMSIAKLAGTMNSTRLGAFISKVLGPKLIADSGEWGTYQWNQLVLGAPGGRIAGGSDEVMRNIVGERVLGLPKDAGIDSKSPFRDLKVGTQKSPA